MVGIVLESRGAAITLACKLTNMAIASKDSFSLSTLIGGSGCIAAPAIAASAAGAAPAALPSPPSAANQPPMAFETVLQFKGFIDEILATAPDGRISAFELMQKVRERIQIDSLSVFDSILKFLEQMGVLHVLGGLVVRGPKAAP